MVDFRQLDELGIDEAEARERFMDSEEFYSACMKIYIRTNNIAKLSALCAAGDWAGALDCVHTMKGAVGNLSLKKLYKHYAEMTDFFRDGEPEKAADMLSDALLMESVMRRAAGMQ